MTGTVTLHGTRADMIIHPSDCIQLQSRNTANLTLEKDNLGFASFMLSLRTEIFAMKAQYIARYRTFSPHGRPGSALDHCREWIGPAIVPGVALSRLEKKCFVILSVSINGKWIRDQDYNDISNEAVRIYHVMRGGFQTIQVDTSTDATKATAIEFMQEQASQVEAECPFAKSLGLIGPGEGMIWKATRSLGRPLKANEDQLHEIPRLWLKTVGSHFTKSRTSSLALPGDTEDMKAHANKFAEACVTDPRLEKRLAVLKEKLQMEQKRVPASRDLARFWSFFEGYDGGGGGEVE